MQTKNGVNEKHQKSDWIETGREEGRAQYVNKNEHLTFWTVIASSEWSMKCAEYIVYYESMNKYIEQRAEHRGYY